MSKYWVSCAILAVVSMSVLAAEPDEGLAARSRWFDFEAFKVAYRKSYSSLAEELMRKKYFLARAFRAFVSSSKYKLGLSPYYLAVNDMSDWSPEEVVDRLYGGVANKTMEHHLLSAKARRVVGGTEVEANATLSRRKRQPGVAWENPNPLEWDELEEVLEAMEGELGEFNPVGLLMGRYANKNLGKRMMEVKPHQMLPNGDIVFVDHRDSGCITEVRHQGDCGSCYAISILSMFEWIYCMKTERLIEFSEQYLVDCGRPFGLEGCVKGPLEGASEFVNSVGLELREDYPYHAKEESCPYEFQLHPNVARGSIRMQFRKAYLCPPKMLPVMVTHSPASVRTIFLPGTLEQYGGGVLSRGPCSNDAHGHEMLIVGHGVERRIEYWLVKNSWGQHWGEGGYIKIDKSLTEWCINIGAIVIGTNVEGTSEIDVYDNHLNQRQVVGLLRERDSGSTDSGDQDVPKKKRPKLRRFLR